MYIDVGCTWECVITGGAFSVFKFLRSNKRQINSNNVKQQLAHVIGKFLIWAMSDRTVRLTGCAHAHKILCTIR